MCWAFYICVGIILFISGRVYRVLGILHMYRVYSFVVGRVYSVLGILYVYWDHSFIAGLVHVVLGNLYLYWALLLLLGVPIVAVLNLWLGVPFRGRDCGIRLSLSPVNHRLYSVADI